MAKKRPGHPKGPRQKPREHDPEDPQNRRLTTRQATYFAEASGLDAKDLAGQPIGEVAERLRWTIDPQLWFYQRVCGRVVKTDPATGEKRGVPFATVHLEDTDCSFLGLFPVEHPYFWWLFPHNCHRETITTVTTDECGDFCVDIPRWDIDRILRLRIERRCFPEIFRPRIPDLIARIPDLRIPEIDPIDPSPVELVTGKTLADQVPDRPARFGDPVDQPLEAPVGSMAPPLDEAARERAAQALPEDARNQIPLPSPRQAIGPFLRCRDVLVAEWEWIADVPDITFRVTQDVDGDGNDEVIYSESYFDVRWNDSDIGPVELEASPIAKATSACNLDPVPCSDVPALLQIGRMPAVAPYLDGSGYATRVNRPRAGGDPGAAKVGDAESPFTGELQISGCYDSEEDAEYFRILDEYEGVEQAITGVSWTVGATVPPFWITMTPDANGWYPIAEAQKQVDPHLLMSWPIAARGSGPHSLRLELANSSKDHVAFSDPLPVMVDDRAPDLSLASVRWRASSAISWADAEELVGQDCPVVERPVGSDVEVRVVWSASAEHFRNAGLGGHGCGVGSTLEHVGGSPPGSAVVVSPTEVARWHATTAETGLTRTDQFRIAASASQGAYAVTASAWTRAFEPAGAAGPSADWHIDRSDRGRHNRLRFAVIDT